MKVSAFKEDKEFLDRQRTDLEFLLDQPTDKQLRPCPGCTVPCPCSKSPTCSCGCSPSCESCAKHMSSEPDRYPIEPRIIPLVYALHASRVCPPCWSCEGHLTADGSTLAKFPRVWFYSGSVLYPRFVAEHIDDLTFRKKLKNMWTVRVLSWGTGPWSRFSIEPISDSAAPTDLRRLQYEADIIAEGLNVALRQKATDYLRKFLRAS